MKIIKAIFNSIDWFKILYLTFIVFLAKYCFLYGFGYDTTLSFIDISLLSISYGFFYKATYLAVYYYENLNLKKKSFLCYFKYTSIIFNIIGIMIGSYLSVKIDKPYASFLFFSLSLLSFVYSRYTDKKSFLSNLIKSFIIPLIVCCVWYFDTPINLLPNEWEFFFNLQFIIILYLFLSFMGTLNQEIIKDISNINEDYLNKNKTLPILLGRKRAKIIALTLMITSAFLIGGIALYLMSERFLYRTIIITTLFPQIILIYLAIKTTTNKGFKKLIKIMNWFKLFGIIGVVLIAYYFKYVA